MTLREPGLPPLHKRTTTAPAQHARESTWQRLVYGLLTWVERAWLHATGWTRVPGESREFYHPPDDYAFRRHERYERTHAVNAQRQVLAQQRRLPPPENRRKVKAPASWWVDDDLELEAQLRASVESGKRRAIPKVGES